MIRFRDPALLDFESPDETSIKRYRDYLTGNHDALDDYEQRLARAFGAVRDYMRL